LPAVEGEGDIPADLAARGHAADEREQQHRGEDTEGEHAQEILQPAEPHIEAEQETQH
jgi:hypothetical protein